MKKIIKILTIILIILFLALIIGIIGSLFYQTNPTIDISNKEIIKDSTVIIKQIAPIDLIVIEYEQNCAGGNAVLITAINKTNETIAWVQYDLYFLNVKGEILLDDIRGWCKMSIYHGPIEPYERIEIKNANLFYNFAFRGHYAIDNIIIHYKNGTEKIITLQDFNKYEPFIFNSGNNLVICGKYHPYYHIEGCSKLEKNRILCDLVITIKEARDMEIIRCPECLPY